METGGLRLYQIRYGHHYFVDFFQLSSLNISPGHVYAITPPSIRIVSPVINELSSEARNVTSLPTSSGVPKRPKGVTHFDFHGMFYPLHLLRYLLNYQLMVFRLYQVLSRLHEYFHDHIQWQ